MRGGILGLVVLGCGDGDSGKPMDAANGQDTTVIDAAIDADPNAICGGLAPGGTHVLFLAFDSVALAPGSDDATVNHAAYASQSVTVPNWRPSATNRAALIEQIACDIRAGLDAFNVRVVTTRPASGGYQMVMFGGNSGNLFQIIGYMSLASQDCTDTIANNIGWVADTAGGITLTPQETANMALSVVGTYNAADGTTGDSSDCLCDSNVSSCVLSTTARCSYHNGATVDQNTKVCQGATQDEIALLTARYGPR